MTYYKPQWFLIVASVVFGFAAVAPLAETPFLFWCKATGLTLFGVFLCALSISLQDRGRP